MDAGADALCTSTKITHLGRGRHHIVGGLGLDRTNMTSIRTFVFVSSDIFGSIDPLVTPLVVPEVLELMPGMEDYEAVSKCQDRAGSESGIVTYS